MKATVKFKNYGVAYGKSRNLDGSRPICVDYRAKHVSVWV